MPSVSVACIALPQADANHILFIIHQRWRWFMEKSKVIIVATVMCATWPQAFVCLRLASLSCVFEVLDGISSPDHRSQGIDAW